MLADRSPEVGTMGSGLCHNFMEGPAGSLPVGGLHSHEGSNAQSRRESEHPSVSRRPDDGSHEGEGHQPSEGQVSNELSTQFLQLR